MTEYLNKVHQGEIASNQTFGYNEPISPITRNGFIGAFWGDVNPQPIDVLPVRGSMRNVQVFGFQALRREGDKSASIEMHPEPTQTELTYPIQGEMNMTIQTPHENEVISYMRGAVPMGANLREAHFHLDNNGALMIHVNGHEYVSFATVTPVGSSHGTTPMTDECIYLAVKVNQ